MSAVSRNTFATLATLVAISFAAPLAAQTHAHDHSAAPARLQLDHGRKWATDAPLRAGMQNIRALVGPQLHAAHAGKLGAGQYRALASKVEAEVGAIVAQCKLAPEADAMLHLVIADIGAGIDAMAGKDAAHRPADGLTRVAHALDQYGRYFDHPGFKPLHK
jgi:hypothetical protein